MSEVAAIGGASGRGRVRARRCAACYPADGRGQVQAAWRALPATVAVVILTPAAAEALQRPPACAAGAADGGDAV